jgi:hypothetical protein
MRKTGIAGALALLTCSTIGWAQNEMNAAPAASAVPAAASVKTKPKSDPNKIVCETVETLGTRLGGHRECKTRAQWAEERRLNRESIDRSQTMKSCSQTSGC